jgi:hypothetical protein
LTKIDNKGVFWHSARIGINETGSSIPQKHGDIRTYFTYNQDKRSSASPRPLIGLRLAVTQLTPPIRRLTASQEMPFGHFRQPQPR